MTGFLIYSLFINFEMHSSMNLLEYPLDKSISFYLTDILQFQSETLTYQKLSKSSDVITYKPVQICVLIV